MKCDHLKCKSMSLYDENGDHVGMNEENNNVLSVDFEETTTKYIVVRAINGEQGRFQVKWWREGEAAPDEISERNHLN